jgi:predicted transposase YbfD/YdcC
MPLPISHVFADLPDPRSEINRRHLLTDILTIALCGVISGADGWEDIAEYGRSKKDFFERCLPLPNGIPSHDTFYRVFARLDPAAFAERVGRWMAAACEATGLIPVAIDGKSARRARAATATGCLHTVSAWATANGLTLGQVAVPDGSNEIAVVPDLLRVLDLAGAIVTIDAAGCQTENARLIRDGGGHYLLAVKGNQPNLHKAVEAAFGRADAAGWEGIRFDTHTSAEDGHGRHEERMTTVIYDPAGLPPDWPDVAAVVLIGRERSVGDASTFAGHYYIASHAGTAEELGGLARSHRQIENGLHWVLDVAFREDESRTRDAKAGANLALLRRVAVSLLKRAAAKGSIHTRRLKAAWDDAFLQQVLKGVSADSGFA